MKSLIAIIAIIILHTSLRGQTNVGSVLKDNDSYSIDPTTYLSRIPSEKITTGILIDRTYYDDLILNINGYDKVTTISSGQWARLYDYMEDAAITRNLQPVGRINDLIAANFKSHSVCPIGLLDFDFQRIKQESIENGDFVPTEDYLIDEKAGSNSFSTHRLFAASCLKYSIYGDEISFIIPDLFTFSNTPSLEIESIEVDFGNGSGFQLVQINEMVSVYYGSNSEHLLLKLKVKLRNANSGEADVRYAHCTVLRKGTETVPLPDIIPNISYAERGEPVSEDRKSYYPTSSSKIEYYILFSPQNVDKNKLRRPLVISDAFDPGNKRDYYKTSYTNTEWDDLLPKDKDDRGMYEILSGDPSPWYPGVQSPNLLAQLRNDGYDLIFINYLDGAGDLYTNTNALRGFFNEILNGTLRDNKTEELILVGPSMGGIITRLMLTKMEQAGENHYVKLWVSYDAPQTGAYIPLGLQHSLSFLTQIHSGGLSALKKAKAAFEKGKEKINSDAAQQMLMYHYTATSSSGNSTSKFNTLYADLNQLGYPKYSKNYAISNGGKHKLYANEGTAILDFKIFKWTYTTGWSHKNEPGQYKIFDGSRQGANNDETIETISHIGYENSPGGWNASLYSVNYVEGNKNQKSDDSNLPFTRSTFMTIPTAFGVPSTRNNIYKSHEEYTNCNDENPGNKIKTPFDAIRGMNENEEHVTVSPSTSEYLFWELRYDFENTTRPRIRSGQTIAQNIRGQLAYTVKEAIEFAGHENSISFENGSDVIVSSGKKITFSPGFSAKTGARITAKIEEVDYGTVLRTAEAQNTSQIDYSNPSPFIYTLYDYSTANENNSNSSFKCLVYPNPLKNIANIEISGITQGASLEVINILGQTIYKMGLITNGTQLIDLSAYQPGVYNIKIIQENQVFNYKIIKQ